MCWSSEPLYIWNVQRPYFSPCCSASVLTEPQQGCNTEYIWTIKLKVMNDVEKLSRNKFLQTSEAFHCSIFFYEDESTKYFRICNRVSVISAELCSAYTRGLHLYWWQVIVVTLHTSFYNKTNKGLGVRWEENLKNKTQNSRTFWPLSNRREAKMLHD